LVEVPEAGANEMNVAAILKLKGGKTVVTTTADKSMLDVAKLLTQHSIGCIVIERDDGEVAGIVSERDLMRAIGHSGAKVLKEPVSVYMTKTVVTAREADTSDQLMSEMTSHRFRHMPVVERGRLLGLVSIGDLVKIHVADAEFESDAMRQYITSPPSLLYEQPSQLRLAGVA
jgi:CBS domain-containing protein